jgi:hypothetical protein
LHRFHEAGSPSDGTVTFTLHAFLRAMGRRVDGRTYEQLRGALTRLERTILESSSTYFVAAAMQSPTSIRLAVVGRHVEERLTVLTSVAIDRRRSADRDQLPLFATLSTSEPGEARVTLSPLLRANIEAGYTTTLSAAQYFALPSPTARRLYRLIMAVQAEATETPTRTEATSAGERLEASEPPSAQAVHTSATVTPQGTFVWNVALDALAEQLPLSQRYPSHLQRVLEPAHTMLKAAGLVREATVRQQRRAWVVHYEL